MEFDKEYYDKEAEEDKIRKDGYLLVGLRDGTIMKRPYSGESSVNDDSAVYLMKSHC